jgi:hypothetical protein
MTNQVKTDYYISRKAKLLKGFDKVAKRATKFLINHYGDDFALVILAETREKFKQIIPEIPYIGGKRNQIPTTVMIINGWIIPFFQVMKAHGKTSEEVITICCEVSDDYMKSLPRFFLWLLRKLAFWRLMINKLLLLLHPVWQKAEDRCQRTRLRLSASPRQAEGRKLIIASKFTTEEHGISVVKNSC